MSHPSLLEKYNHAFKEGVLKELNEIQLEAVQQIEGPVIVIAGPGTGKTHILAARVGNILLNTDIQARNILCLTFTESAVTAMRKRLLSFIGPEAHKVPIYTFHSFCNRIIQEHLELFGMYDLDPLNDLERIEIIRDLLDDLPHSHPLRIGKSNVYFFERHLQQLFRLMKLERWTTYNIHQAVDEYLNSLETRKEFVYQVNRGAYIKGQPKEAKVAAEIQKMNRLKAAASLFATYNSSLKKANRYDYEDMILWVINSFENNEWLLRLYQEQYHYLLIDEYQDTNGAQSDIIQKLTSFWSHPNVFIVGDDDQSIFEFQGARLKNLVDFYNQHENDLRLFVLKDNYRSSQNILDTAFHVIGYNQKRITTALDKVVIDKQLLARHDLFARSLLNPVLLNYKNRNQEVVGIVNAINDLHKSGFPLHEVAVIYARHRQATPIIELLEKQGIPYQTKRRLNLLDIPLVAQMRQLLEYFVLEQEYPGKGNALLFQILHYPFLELSRASIEQMYLSALQANEAEKVLWKQILKDFSQTGNGDTAVQRRASEVYDFLNKAQEQLFIQPLPYFLEWLLPTSGIVHYALNHPKKVWMVQVLKAFLDFVKSESQKKPRQGLKAFLEMLRQMDENRLAIEIVDEINMEEGVHLLTAHSAKGLEFQRVYIIDAVKENWEPNSRAATFQFSMPDTLTYSGEEDAMEARRRLFFVALTRAKEWLQISYSNENEVGKPIEKAVFVDEMLESGLVDHQIPELRPDEMAASQLLSVSVQQAPNIPALEVTKIKEIVSGFKLSASSLAQYLDCPLTFYYIYILKAPGIPSEAASYGISVHGALYQIFAQMLQDKHKDFPDEAAFLDYFEKEMDLHSHLMSVKGFQRYLKQGKANLSAFYKKHVEKWHKSVKVEHMIRETVFQGVPLTGTIDKIEYFPGQMATIVDYKTGSHQKDKLAPPTPAKPYGGNYWRQMHFYKILAESFDPFGDKYDKGKVVYIDPDQGGEIPEKIIPLNIEGTILVGQWIVETYEKIQKMEFEQRCNKPTCKWCGFVSKLEHTENQGYGIIEELDDK